MTAMLLCLAVFSGCALSEGNDAFPSVNSPSDRSPVFFEEADFSSLSQSSPPSVSAKAYVLIDADSGCVISSRAPDERMKMASTTKIMTALVALENADVNRVVSIPKEAVGVEGSSIYLFEGEALTLEALLYAMLLESANDAAAAIAITVGGSIEGFADMMNEKAEELGLENTHFTNPHGLDGDEHYTTARDLALIAAEAMRNESFCEIVSTQKKTIPLNNTEGVRLLINHNKLLRSYEGAIGIKTGFTKKSGRCLVSAAERDGVRLICVTLSAPDDWRDHKGLLDYGFEALSSRLLCSEESLEYTVPVVGGNAEYVTLTNKDEIRITLPKSAPEVTVTVELPRFLYAPVKVGEAIGRAVYSIDGKTIAEVPLYARYSVPQKEEKSTLWEKITSLFK